MNNNDMKAAVSAKGYNLFPISAIDGKETNDHALIDSSLRYMATVEVDGNYATFNGNLYDDADALLNAVRIHNESLPMSPAYYNPLKTRKEATENTVIDYLIKSGLELDRKNGFEDPRYVIKDIYGMPVISLSVCMLDSEDKDSERGMVLDARRDGNAPKLIYSEFKDGPEAISVINGMLESLALTHIASEIAMLDRLSPERKYDSVKSMNMDSLSETDMKDFLRERLQKALDSLK